MVQKMEVSTSVVNMVCVGLVLRAVNLETSKDFLCSTILIAVAE